MEFSIWNAAAPSRPIFTPGAISFASRCLALFAMLALWLGASPAAHAQPPHEIHYQGRLTDNANNPLTGTHTLFFRIYSGGTATAGGTEVFRESIALALLPDGIFEHRIGTGTILTGVLNEALFKTTSPLYLQIDVDTLNNAVLPRARFTSVGYALVAGDAVGDIHPKSVSIEGYGEVIDANGVWQGESIPSGIVGTPVATTVTDATGGGRLVIGDLLQIDGTGLLNAVVLVGGRIAPIKTRTATQIVCQVPERTPMGLNPVALVVNGAGGASTTVAHVEVHRLLVAIRSNNGNGVANIIDAFTNTVVNEIALGSMSNATRPLQTAFAHQGALLLVPNGNNSTIYAIDLTSNPPALRDSQTVGTGAALGVAVNPSGTEAMVCFPASNRANAVSIGETAPPYTVAVLGANTATDALPTGINPRAALFMTDKNVMLMGSTTLLNLRRAGVRDYELHDDAETPNDLDDKDRIGGFSTSISMTPSHDRNRLFVVTQAATNVSVVHPAVFWAQGYTPTAAGTTSPSPYKVALTPDDELLFAASESTDRLQYFAVVGDSLRLVGLIPGPEDTSEHFQMVAVEPVTGKTVAVTTNENSLYLFDRGFAGGVGILDFEDLTDVTRIAFSTTIRASMDLVFQP